MLFRGASRVCVVFVLMLGCGSSGAASPDVCMTLAIAKVNELTHLNLVGVRADVSEEAHSFGCSYGNGGLVSVSLIRPGGSAAFLRTTSRYPKAVAVPGLGDKAVYDKSVGTIALFGDMVIDAFVKPGTMSEEQALASEKALIAALRDKL